MNSDLPRLGAANLNQEDIMKRTTLSTMLVLAFGILAIVGAAPTLLAHDDHSCSLRSVAGTYGYTLTGNIVAGPAAGPTGAAGIITFDRNGNLLDGSQVRSFNGSIADETLDGTYTVNDDCTGEATINVYQDETLVRTSQLHIVWVDRSSEARAIFRTPFTAITVNAKKVKD